MTKRNEQARDYAAEQGWKYVRVYGAGGDGMRLTDDERDELREVMDFYDKNAFGKCSAALRRLLERPT